MLDDVAYVRDVAIGIHHHREGVPLVLTNERWSKRR